MKNIKRITLAVFLFCAVTTMLRAQSSHSLQLNNASGAITILTGSASGGTYTFPNGGGTIMTATPGGVSSAWLTTGNNGTVAGTNFLGTIDNVALDIRTFNTIRLRFNTTTNSIQRDAGGNVRGSDAIDLQVTRSVATQVASGNQSVIGGGQYNTASGYVSTVGGGYTNTANNVYSTIGGGGYNTATGGYSTIGGGALDTAAGGYSTIGGGYINNATGNFSTIGGGGENSATNISATVGGGAGNAAGGFASVVGGGLNNGALGNYSTIAGGINNGASALAVRASIGGGTNNQATNQFAVIGGGIDNIAAGNRSAILGGGTNHANGDYTAILGGRGMQLDGTRALGWNANDIVLARDMTVAANDVAVFANANMWLANNNNTASQLRFYQPQNTTGAFPVAATKYSAFQASATAQAADIIYTLPAVAPTAGQVLSSTAGGVMSWTSMAFADFYALMPADNAATIAAGTAVGFPQDGPISGSISRLSATTFNLANIGTYEVFFQVSVTESGQLMLRINGAELAYTVVGRATGTTQLTGMCLVATTLVNTTLEVVNPSGNVPALTISPLAGGTHAVSAHLVIKQVQ